MHFVAEDDGMDIGKLFRDAWGLFVKDIGPLIVGMLIASIVPAVAGAAIAAATIGAGIGGLQVDAQGTVTGMDSLNWVLIGIGSLAIVVVTLFLSVPLYVGILTGVFRRVREGREMAYGDAFAGFSIFGKVIWAAVLLGVIFTALFAVPTALIVGGVVAGSALLVGLGVVVFLAAVAASIYLGIVWTYVYPVIVDRGLGVTAAMGESRRLVHGSGWWWTFLVLFLLELVVGAVSFALGLIPFIGAVATIVLYPFVLTYVVAMYFQARSEGWLIDAVLGWPRQAPAGPRAYSAPAAPYSPAPVPPAPPYPAPPPSSPPAVEYGQASAPAPAPLAPPPGPADVGQSTEPLPPATAVTQPAAPEAPEQPATPEAPPAPEPPASSPGL
jgi:hypothetical protein